MTDFGNIIERRSFLQGAFILGASAFVYTAGSPRTVYSHEAITFNPVTANGLDTITLPEDYEWHVVVRWGDPMWSGVPEFDPETRGSIESQSLSFGDNCDGMSLFQVRGRSILVVNNEYTNRNIMFGNRESRNPESPEDAKKGMMAHGVCVLELVQQQGRWRPLKDSPYNRKITPETKMVFTGPATGHDLLKTEADPDGVWTLGTWNNCGNGRTPWGTYLTCEENFNGYFSSPSDPETAMPQTHQRYGIKNKDWGYGWSTVDGRFDVALNPNEPNRAGYIVEIDPAQPQSVPRKHTAMGRFKHENCEVVIANNGHVVAYMGDDERGEFLYRFVSDGKYQPGSDSNYSLLESGILSVAVFDENGSGQWVNLTPRSTGMSEAEICVNTRIAASKVKATTMDRPEWVAANPYKAEAYCCLTNNKSRGVHPNAGGDPTPVNGPNPRAKNLYGQIVRWTPRNSDHTAMNFSWDLFAIAGNPGLYNDHRAGSENITEANMFNSPDGLAFDSLGNLWIQTDGKYSDEGEYSGMGNNQMLMANPKTGELKRFMVGPKECEVTGITWSVDKRTMFVGIQHPGEKNPDTCHFPDGGESMPRSSVIAITRKDGGYIG